MQTMQSITTTDRNSFSGGSDSRGNSFNAESIDAGSAAVLIQALKQSSSSPSPPPVNYNNYNSNSGNRGRSESSNSNPPADLSRENSATNIHSLKKTVSQEALDEDEVETTRISDTKPEMVLQANPLLSSRSPSTGNSPSKPVTEKKEVAKQSFEASNPILAAMNNNNNKKSENEVLYEENPVLSEQRKEKSVSFAEEGSAQSNKPAEKNDEEDKEGGEEGKSTSSPNQGGGAAAAGTSRRVGRSRLGHRYRPAPPSSSTTTATASPPPAPSTNEEA
jgi:hypothetical protein